MYGKYSVITLFLLILGYTANTSYGSINNEFPSEFREKSFSSLNTGQSISSDPSIICKSENTISNSCNINECLAIGSNSCNTSENSNGIDTATILVEKEEAGSGSMEPHHFEVTVVGKNANPDTFHPDP